MGHCVEASPVDCVGTYIPATCQVGCENRVYTISTEASGGGTQCGQSAGDTSPCQPGMGECPAGKRHMFTCISSGHISPLPSISIIIIFPRKPSENNQYLVSEFNKVSR